MKPDIPFNDPFISKNSKDYIFDALHRKDISGPGYYCARVNQFLSDHFSTPTRLTTSCTSALEAAMTAIGVQQGDEVILPSYTFTSTANCVALRGATPVFVDIDQNLFIDIESLQSAINKKTKAILAVHIAGNCGDIDKLQKIAEANSLFLIEDAAQAFGATYKGKKLGTFGDIGTFSFHGTKNITCGEGGCIVINNKRLQEKIDIILEKGTNRKKFYEGSIDKYEWVDLGSSYIPSDLIAAFLLGNLECYEFINNKRMKVWQSYDNFFKLFTPQNLEKMITNKFCKHNAHMYYILIQDSEIRSKMITYLRQKSIGSAFHYVPLHSSPAGRKYGRAHGSLDLTTNVANRLLRLPMSIDTKFEVVIAAIKDFYTT